MELKLLRAFVTVAEELHFGRAAKRLHVSQPPLSVQIRRLEADLGCALFERSRRGVALTEAGQALLGRARHLLAEAERARDELERLQRGQSGVLAIGYTPTATYQLLPRVLPAYRGMRPDVRLELIELSSAQQVAALNRGRIEVGFVCSPLAPHDLREEPLVRERPLLAVPERHRLARKPRVALGELGDEPFVTVKSEIEPGWADAAARLLQKHGIAPRVAQETDSKLALLGLVAAGVGIAIVSESLGSWQRAGVVLRPLQSVSLKFTLSLLSHPRSSPRARDFARIALEHRPGPRP